MSASATSAPSLREPGRAPRPLWRHPAFVGTLAAAGALALLSPLWWEPLASALTDLEFALAERVPAGVVAEAAWWLLPAVGFGAGVLASLSPCILPLVPLNVAYIGAADASGARAVGLSARFVLGAAAALAVLGLAGDLAGVLLIEQRGPVLLVVGAAMIYFGVAALELAPMPFAGRSPGGTRRLGPVGAGATFSLVTTPCASPLLGAVLAAAAAAAVAGLTVVTMVAFALGYTLLVFLAGAFGGSLVARLRARSFEAPRAGAAALLIVVGAGFGLLGLRWF